MYKDNLIKRSLAGGLVIAAAGFPAVSQARYVEDPAGSIAPSQLVTRSSAAHAGATSHSPFQWGDAGIGAAGTIVLLGAGAGAAGAVRRRGAHRAAIG